MKRVEIGAVDIRQWESEIDRAVDDCQVLAITQDGEPIAYLYPAAIADFEFEEEA